MVQVPEAIQEGDDDVEQPSMSPAILLESPVGGCHRAQPCRSKREEPELMNDRQTSAAREVEGGWRHVIKFRASRPVVGRGE